jgi:hypothetical protein
MHRPGPVRRAHPGRPLSGGSASDWVGVIVCDYVYEIEWGCAIVSICVCEIVWDCISVCMRSYGIMVV